VGFRPAAQASASGDRCPSGVVRMQTVHVHHCQDQHQQDYERVYEEQHASAYGLVLCSCNQPTLWQAGGRL